MKKHASLNGVKEKQFSDKAVNKLKIYDWQGNIREIKNTTHCALLAFRLNYRRTGFFTTAA